MRIRLILLLLFLFPSVAFPLVDGDPLEVPGAVEITVLGTVVTGTWNATAITIPYGGTGGISFTDHGVMLGSGTDPLTVTAVGTNGQLLIGSTGADPVFATLTAGDGLTATIGAGTLELDADISGDGVYADHAVIRGDGGAKGIQDSSVTIEDSGSMTMTGGDLELTSGDIDLLEGGVFLASIYTKSPRIFLDNYHDDTNSSRIEFWKLPDTLSDDDQIGYIAGFTIRDSQPAAYMDFRISDESVDHIGGEVNFGVKVDDVTKYLLRLRGYTGTQGEAEVLFNDSAADIDFIIRKETAGDALVYDAGNDTFTFNSPIILIGTARAWRSRDLDPTSVRSPGANAPANDTIDNFGFHRYDDEVEESVYFHWGVPDDYGEGTANVRGQFKFVVGSPPTGGDGDEVVVMGFEYKIIPEGGVFDFTGGTTTGTLLETIVEDETPWIHHLTAYGTLDTTGLVHGDTILFRFFRDATNGADTYENDGPGNNDAWVWDYHLEYITDRFGRTP